MIIKYIKKSLELSWKVSKKLFVCRVAIELLLVIIPIIILKNTSYILNVFTIQETNNNKRYMFITAIFTIIIFQILKMLFEKIRFLVNEFHEERVFNYLQIEILEKINSLDIFYFDNTQFYNDIENSYKDSQAVISFVGNVFMAVGGVVQFFSSFFILMRLNILFPFLIITLYIPVIFIDNYLSKKNFQWQREKILHERKIIYVRNLLRKKEFAKDIRCFGIKSYFMTNYQNLIKKLYVEKVYVETRRVILSFIARVLPYFGSFIILFIIGSRILKNELIIGDFTFYSGIINQIIFSIATLIGSVVKCIESQLRFQRYTDFLKLKPIISYEGKENIENITEIRFEKVCFRYPDEKKEIIHNLSFEIRKGERTAIVGINGSGKSTIVKLLLRLYDPTSGRILVNGKDLKDYDINKYYSCISVMFQDFNKYFLKLNETISITEIKHRESYKKIYDACEKAGLNIDKKKWHDFENIYLGKIFSNDGIELSGGEWQKIALAQTFFKNSSFVIMDEPNSALDAISESQLFDNLNLYSRDKFVLFISHRLYSTVDANQIIVISNGECIERGKHNDLMKLNGDYAKLFVAQAQKFNKGGMEYVQRNIPISY